MPAAKRSKTYKMKEKSWLGHEKIKNSQSGCIDTYVQLEKHATRIHVGTYTYYIHTTGGLMSFIH